MEPVLAKNHISYPLAVAVIFPELVRYSALRDKMEITLLKALYINLGDRLCKFLNWPVPDETIICRNDTRTG